jgi:hypothetical protein
LGSYNYSLQLKCNKILCRVQKLNTDLKNAATKHLKKTINFNVVIISIIFLITFLKTYKNPPTSAYKSLLSLQSYEKGQKYVLVISAELVPSSRFLLFVSCKTLPCYWPNNFLVGFTLASVSFANLDADEVKYADVMTNLHMLSTR